VEPEAEKSETGQGGWPVSEGERERIILGFYDFAVSMPF
jgi:hypothetical protein